jgi:hypothetical protein
VIVLDTNVVSELARPQPAPEVVAWVDAQDSADLVITAVTAAEIRAGVALLPTGRRRRQIAERMETLITETFAGYVLAFDVDSSARYETCSRCGQQIIVSSSGFVTHVSADGGLNRGCRAASFHPDHGWDHNIPRSWSAKRAK